MEEKYHTDEDGNYILDGDGKKIPSWVCLCFAYSADECTCGAWLIPVSHKTQVLPND